MPRLSSIGLQAALAAAATAPSVSSSSGRPATAASASVTRTTVGATAPRAMTRTGAAPGLVQRDPGAHADDRDVHLGAGDEPQVGVAGAGGRKVELELHDELAGPERRLAGAGDDVLDGDRAGRAGRRRGGDHRTHAVHDHGRHRVGGRRRVAQVPAEAAAALDLVGPDEPGRFDEAGEGGGELGVLGQADRRRGRADRPTGASSRQRNEAIDPLQVDEAVRLRPAGAAAAGSGRWRRRRRGPRPMRAARPPPPPTSVRRTSHAPPSRRHRRRTVPHSSAAVIDSRRAAVGSDSGRDALAVGARPTS